MDDTPRTVRERLTKLLGTKVTLGTSDDHYISGRIQEVDGAHVKLAVNDEIVVVATKTVVTIREAPALQAEYVK